MLRGGVTSIGESRLENVERLRAAGIAGPFMLLRVPALSRADRVIETVELSLNSELSVLAALSDAARRTGRPHPVIVMVDLGDLREGVWPTELVPFAREVAKLEGLRLTGLGANLTCFGGLVPTAAHMERFISLVEEVERELATFRSEADRARA